MFIFKRYIAFLILLLFSVLSSFSQAKIDSLKKVLKTQTEDTVRVNTLNKISNEVVSSNQSEAEQFARKALRLARKLNYRKGIAAAYHNIGNTFYYRNIIDSALSHYERALDIRQAIDDKFGMASTLNNLGVIYQYYIGDIDKALEYNKKSLEINLELGDEKGVAMSYYNIGSLYGDVGNYSEALINLNKGLALSSKIGYKRGKASCYNAIGTIYDNQGDYQRALENYFSGLKINEELGVRTDIGQSYNNIGIISEKMGHLDEALSYYKKTLKIKQEIQDYNGVAISLNNIGNIYVEKAKEDSSYIQKAIDNYTQSLNIAKEIKNGKIEADSYLNIATVFKKNGKYYQAIQNYEKSKEIKTYFSDKRGIASVNVGIGECYYELGDYQMAIKILKKVYEFGQSSNSLELLKASSNLLSLSHSKIGDYKKAFEYSIEQNTIAQNLKNDENTKKITQLSMQYESEKKLDSLKYRQKEQNLAAQAKINRQKVLIYSAVIVIVLMILLTVVILRNAKIMQTKNKLLAHQKEEIERKNKSITDSITYASKIQQALLPTDDFGGNFISDHFILLKPRDIVSGDFYWVRQKGNKILVSAADCTGHGVPGALMSMLGISFLNDILNNLKPSEIEADKILNILRSKVKKSLRQRGKENEAQDGMDMALCVIDTDTYELQFAGAYNPLYLIRNDELTRFKPDRMPIGIYVREKPSFTKYETKLQSGDTLYMFSDGYIDQFDESGEQKFMSKPFKRLLLNNQDKNLEEQRKVLEKTLQQWQGNSEQIDDILVLGLKIV